MYESQKMTETQIYSTMQLHADIILLTDTGSNSIPDETGVKSNQVARFPC